MAGGFLVNWSVSESEGTDAALPTNLHVFICQCVLIWVTEQSVMLQFVEFKGTTNKSLQQPLSVIIVLLVDWVDFISLWIVLLHSLFQLLSFTHAVSSCDL